MIINISTISDRTWLGRTMRWPLRFVPLRYSVPILQGPLAGSKWIVGSSDHGCWLGSYEASRQKALQRLLKPGDVVFDIGAHVGFYTLLASKLVGEGGRVVAFEPVPRNLSLLRRHVSLNKSTNVTLVEGAVAAAEGRVSLVEGLSTTTGQIAAHGTLNVRSMSIDGLVFREAFPPPAVMKIDVEGAEEQVLQGARGVLTTFRPIVLLSTHGPDIHTACCDRLRAASYTLEAEAGGSVDACAELIATPVRLARPERRVDRD